MKIPNIEHLEAEKDRISWPRFRYSNFKDTGAFKSWFSIQRYWSGKLIKVSVRHHSLTIDFRRNAMADLIP